MKVQCNVCLESPIVELPDINSANEDDSVRCPVCDKWIATASVSYDVAMNETMYWSLEDTEFVTEDGKIIKDYPIKLISK